MGDYLEEWKSDISMSEKLWTEKYPSRTFNQLSRASASILPSNKGISKLTCTLKGGASRKQLLIEYALDAARIRRNIWVKLSIISFLYRSRPSSSNELIGYPAPLSLFSSAMGGHLGWWEWSSETSPRPKSLYLDLVEDMRRDTIKEQLGSDTTDLDLCGNEMK